MLAGGNIGMVTPVELQKGNNRTSILFDKVNFRTRYHDDGRVLINSELVDHITTGELWEKLIVRTFAHYVKAPSQEEAQLMLHRLSSVYKEKKRLSRPPIESVTEEDLTALVTDTLKESKREEVLNEKTATDGDNKVRWRDSRQGKSLDFPDVHEVKAAPVKKISCDVQRQGGVRVRFNGAISLEIDDVPDKEEDFAAEEARFVTLINVNDTLLKEVLIEEHRRLDEEVFVSSFS